VGVVQGGCLNTKPKHTSNSRQTPQSSQNLDRLPRSTPSNSVTVGGRSTGATRGDSLPRKPKHTPNSRQTPQPLRDSGETPKATERNSQKIMARLSWIVKKKISAKVQGFAGFWDMFGVWGRAIQPTSILGSEFFGGGVARGLGVGV